MTTKMRIDSELQTVYENIQWVKRVHHLTDRELAKILHIGVPTLRSILNGTFPPRTSIALFFYMADFLNISPAALFKPFPRVD